MPGRDCLAFDQSVVKAFYAKDVPGDLAGCEKCNDAVRLDKPGGPLRDENEQLVVPEVLCLA